MAKFTNRIKSYLQKSLYNGLGIVARNYAKSPEYNPKEQFRGIAYKAIDKIGLTLSVYEPVILRKNGDTYTNHPLLTLFNNPNTLIKSPNDFIHLWAALHEIYGETFWYLVRGENTRRVKEIFLLNPSQVEIKQSNGEIVGYVLHKSDGQQIPLEPDEIIHDKKPNPFNEWRGLSVLEMAAIYINTEIVTANFTLNYIRNSGSPSGIVSLPNMDKEAFKTFAAQWRESYEGPQNAGKTAFIRGEEAKFQAVGATLQDIDQKITREMAKEDVLMMLEVPKPLLGATDSQGLGRSNVETLKYIFAESKIEPMMRRLDKIYTQIAQSFGTEGLVKITHLSPVPEDKEFTHKQNKDLVNIAITVNEVRASLGLEPIKGGDEINANNKVQQPVASANKLRIVKSTPLTKAQLKKQSQDEDESFRVKVVETSDIYAKELKKALTGFFKEQANTVIDKINATAKSFEEWLFNVKEESEKMATIITPIIFDLVEAQVEGVTNLITGELVALTEKQRATIGANILKLSGEVNKETIDILNTTLTQGQSKGESLARLKKRVEQVYADAKGYRAERIARTESLRESNRASEIVYQNNGYGQVRWVINPGACSFCQTYAGRTKEIGTVFSPVGEVVTDANGNQLKIDYNDIDTPPLHPNCKCNIVPE